MNDFQVIEIVDANTVRVSPKWKLDLKGASFSGDRIRVRGIDIPKEDDIAVGRLSKLLINTPKTVFFNSPELIEHNEDPVVSCSVYLADVNIANYFPEYVYREM